MATTRKTLKAKNKMKNGYGSIVLFRIVDTFERNINKELSKISKKKCPNAVASEILGEILRREPNLLKKHKDILKKYVRGRK